MSVSTKKSSEIINRVNNEGFVFLNFKPEKDLFEFILNSESPSDERYIYRFFINELDKLGITVSSIAGVYEDINKGMSHKLHTHLIPAEFQLVVWVPSGEYKGRDFIYGTKENIKRHHGKYGEMCLMKCNDLNFVHGVDPMESNTNFRTLLLHINITAFDGRHMTVDTDLQDY